MKNLKARDELQKLCKNLNEIKDIYESYITEILEEHGISHEDIESYTDNFDSEGFYQNFFYVQQHIISLESFDECAIDEVLNEHAHEHIDFFKEYMENK